MFRKRIYCFGVASPLPVGWTARVSPTPWATSASITTRRFRLRTTASRSRTSSIWLRSPPTRNCSREMLPLMSRIPQSSALSSGYAGTELGRGLSLLIDGKRLPAAAGFQPGDFSPGRGGPPNHEDGFRLLGGLFADRGNCIPPLRYAPVGMTKGRGAFSVKIGLWLKELSWSSLQYSDNYPGHAGWKEVVETVHQLPVSPIDQQRRVDQRPPDLLNSPPQDLSRNYPISLSVADTAGPATALDSDGMTHQLGTEISK